MYSSTSDLRSVVITLDLLLLGSGGSLGLRHRQPAVSVLNGLSEDQCETTSGLPSSTQA